MDDAMPNQSIPPLGALNTLLSDPEAMKRIAGILGTLSSADAPKQEISDVSPHHQEDSPKKEATTDGFSTLLKDPSFIEKLPTMIAMLKPVLESNAPPKQAPDRHEKKRDYDAKDELLLALKPFLSKERCEAVDTIIRLSKLGNVLKHLH